MNFKTYALIAVLAVPVLVRAEGPANRFGRQTQIPTVTAPQQVSSLTVHDLMYDYDLHTFEWVLKYKMIIHMPNGNTHVQYYNSIPAWQAGYDSWYELRGSVDHYNPPESIEGPFAENVKDNYEFVQRFDMHSQATAAAQSLQSQGELTEIRNILVNDLSAVQMSQSAGTGQSLPQSGSNRRRGRN